MATRTARAEPGEHFEEDSNEIGDVEERNDEKDERDSSLEREKPEKDDEIEEVVKGGKVKEEWRTVKIKEWDIANNHPNSVGDKDGGDKLVVIGKPGTGKSKLIQSI